MIAPGHPDSRMGFRTIRCPLALVSEEGLVAVAIIVVVGAVEVMISKAVARELLVPDVDVTLIP